MIKKREMIFVGETILQIEVLRDQILEVFILNGNKMIDKVTELDNGKI